MLARSLSLSCSHSQDIQAPSLSHTHSTLHLIFILLPSSSPSHFLLPSFSHTQTLLSVSYHAHFLPSFTFSRPPSPFPHCLTHFPLFIFSYSSSFLLHLFSLTLSPSPSTLIFSLPPPSLSHTHIHPPSLTFSYSSPPSFTFIFLLSYSPFLPHVLTLNPSLSNLCLSHVETF